MLRLTRRSTLFLVVLVLASAIDAIPFFLLRHPPASRAARVVIALIPLPGDIAVIVLLLMAIRTLDDFQKRVHFEAVTVAFLSTAVAVFVYGYLQAANVVGVLNTGVVWGFMVIFYLIGYGIAASHYR